MNCLRNKILLLIGVIFLVAPSVFSQIEGAKGFYDKRQIKPFFSLKGDMRGYSDESVRKLNYMMFGIKDLHPIYTLDSNNVVTDIDKDPLASQYKKFHQYNYGNNLEMGVQYNRFITWLNVQFTLPVVSKASQAYNSDTTHSTRMYDAKYYTYGADWMFGWMLLKKESYFNIIPAVGFGANLINLHFTGSYTLYSELFDGGSYTIEDKYYTSLGYTVTAETEFRFKLAGGISLGAIGGYRFAHYDKLIFDVGDDGMEVFFKQDQYLDHWYFGGKITFTLKSQFEKIQAAKEKKKKEESKK